MLQIPTKVLIVVAGVVWLIAGAFVVKTGASAATDPWNSLMAIAMVIVYVAFLILFLQITRKQIRRINSYTEKMTSIYRFFDARAYIIIVVMVFLGAAIRLSDFVPGYFIAPFYCGLGLSLITAACYYVATFVASCDYLIAKQKTPIKPDTPESTS